MKKQIWIIDDEENILEISKIVLEEAGFAVSTFKSENEFLDALQNNLPDLIFLDITLSGSNGIKIAKSLKENGRTASIPLILMSADSEIAKKTQDAQANDFLAKPFNIEDLLSKIKKYHG